MIVDIKPMFLKRQLESLRIFLLFVVGWWVSLFIPYEMFMRLRGAYENFSGFDFTLFGLIIISGFVILLYPYYNRNSGDLKSNMNRVIHSMTKAFLIMLLTGWSAYLILPLSAYGDLTQLPTFIRISSMTIEFHPLSLFFGLFFISGLFIFDNLFKLVNVYRTLRKYALLSIIFAAILDLIFISTHCLYDLSQFNTHVLFKTSILASSFGLVLLLSLHKKPEEIKNKDEEEKENKEPINETLEKNNKTEKNYPHNTKHKETLRKIIFLLEKLLKFLAWLIYTVLLVSSSFILFRFKQDYREEINMQLFLTNIIIGGCIFILFYSLLFLVYNRRVHSNLHKLHVGDYLKEYNRKWDISNINTDRKFPYWIISWIPPLMVLIFYNKASSSPLLGTYSGLWAYILIGVSIIGTIEISFNSQISNTWNRIWYYVSWIVAGYLSFIPTKIEELQAWASWFSNVFITIAILNVIICYLMRLLEYKQMKIG